MKRETWTDGEEQKVLLLETENGVMVSEPSWNFN